MRLTVRELVQAQYLSALGQALDHATTHHKQTPNNSSIWPHMTRIPGVGPRERGGARHLLMMMMMVLMMMMMMMMAPYGPIRPHTNLRPREQPPGICGPGRGAMPPLGQRTHTSEQLREFVRQNLVTLRARSSDGAFKKLRTRNPDGTSNKEEKR